MVVDTERARTRKNLWKRERDTNVREIGEIPKPINARRRSRCKKSLKRYLLTYHERLFSKPFSDHHEKLIQLIERAIFKGLQQAIGFPRGSGKTTICQLAVLWAVLYGHRKFVKIFGCEQDASDAHLEEIITQIMENELLAEDFPEVVLPLRMTERNAIRARRQLYHGELTNVEINSKRIIFPIIGPTVKKGNAGGIIAIATLTGAGSRGSKVRGRRPDLALVDDPQTEKSANSKNLVRERMSCLTGSIMGMAGPGETMSVLVTCTVIKKGDLADQILDRQKHPEWHGIRIKMLENEPIHKDLWLEWQDICRIEYVHERPLDEAHDFYRKHRKKMDEGAKVYWEERYEEGFVSALEQAMFFKLIKFPPEQFASEYQNDPIDEQVADTVMPKPDVIIKKTSAFDRCDVPLEASQITAFIDIQQKALWYTVIAWSQDFTGHVIDYGCWPEQGGRLYYTKSDQQVTLAEQMERGAGLHGAIRNGLDRLLMDDDGLANRRYIREDGIEMPISRGLIDANWGDMTDVIYSFLRSARLSPVWYPSHGIYIRAADKRLGERKPRPGEQQGTSWKLDRHETQLIERVTYDTNWWKTFHCQRWNAAAGDPGCMYLFRGNALHRGEDHRMFADHLNAEFGFAIKVRDKEVTEWMEKPGRPDNEFLDGCVGCCVGASMLGITLSSITPATRSTRKQQTLNADNVAAYYG